MKCGRAFSFLTDPLRCDVFYQCYMWTPYQMACPNGLYFDDRAFVCNWPHAVNCVNGHRKPLFEQVLIDEEANEIVNIQNKLNHKRKSIKYKTRNRNHLRKFLSSNRLQTNEESKSERKTFNRNKIILDNSFHSTNSLSAQHIPGRYDSFASIMATSSFPIGKRRKLSTSEKPFSTITKSKPTPRVFSRKLPWNLTETQGLNIRKTGLKNGSKKEMDVTLSGSKFTFSSSIGTQESNYHQRSFSNQLKENRTNNTSENKIVHENFEQPNNNLHNTSHSNESNSQHEPIRFQKKLAKIEFTIKGSESRQNRKDLQIENQKKIDEFKVSINHSVPNNPVRLPSSMVVNNLKKEKNIESKNDEEFDVKLQCINGSNCIENNENITKNDSEFSSLIENFSNSDNFIVKIDLNECNTSVNICKNETLFNNDMIILISSETITDKTPTDKILLNMPNTNNTKPTNSNSQTTEGPIAKFYSSGNLNESKNDTKYVEKLSIVPSYDNFDNNRFSKGISLNISESVDKLINMKELNETEKNEDTIISQEKLNQPFNDLGKEYKSTERENIFKESKSSLFITKDYSSVDLKSKFEADHDRQQKSVSILHFPKKDILNSKEISRVITQISKMTKTDFLKTTDQNVSESDNLKGNTKNYLILIDRNSDLDLLHSTEVPLDKTKKGNNSSKNKNNNNKNNNNNKSSINIDSLINSSGIKKQEKQLVEQNNDNISDSIKNGKLSRNTTEEGNDFRKFNRTFSEHELSSSETSSVKYKNVNLTANLLKTQHDIHERAKDELNSSRDPIEKTLSALHRTMKTLNNEEHVTAGRRESTLTANGNAVNGTNSDIKITKMINETNRYKKVDLSTFYVQKEKRKNPEPFKKFLYRKIVELFSRFVPEQINATKLLSRLRSMTDTLEKLKNESEFSDGENYTSDISSKNRMFEGNPYKINITEQSTKPGYLDSKFTEITNAHGVSFSEINKPIKESTERIVTSLHNKTTILNIKQSSNNYEGSSYPNKVEDYISFNVTPPLSHPISFRFNESIETFEELPQKDILLYVNSSTEINSTNSSVVSVNLYEEVKNNLYDKMITKIKTNESEIKTKTAKFQTNMTTTKENEYKEAKTKRDNDRLNVNTKFSMDKANMFDGTMSLEEKMSTSNTPVIDLFQENKTYIETYQKSDTENNEIINSNETYTNMSKAPHNNSASLEEIQTEKSQSFVVNASINLNGKEKEEIINGVEDTEKGSKDLQNPFSKDDILNISVNATGFLQEKWGNISHKYNEKAFSRRSKDKNIPDQEQMIETQQLHLSIEPEVATEAQKEFKDLLDPENNTEIFKITNKKEEKLYSTDVKRNKQNESYITEKKKRARFIEDYTTANKKETETEKNMIAENEKSTAGFMINYKSKEHNISYRDETVGKKSYEQATNEQTFNTIENQI